jgi:uncharacterized membrane protein
MKPGNASRSRMGRGFTLAELMMASTTMVLVLGAIVALNLWGLAMTRRSQIWLMANDDARKGMGMLHLDVRAAGAVYVGSGDLNGFTNAGASNIQAGDALKVYASTNTNSWSLYYYNTASNTLYRTNWDGLATGNFDTVLANPITNDSFIFTEQDYLGNILSNATPFPVIAIYLSFTKLQNPQIVIAPGQPVDFYQINSKIAPRMRP